MKIVLHEIEKVPSKTSPTSTILPWRFTSAITALATR